MSGSITALNSYLEPLMPFFGVDGVTEVSINKPKEIWVETLGEVSKTDVPSLDYNHLRGMATLIAQFTDQSISEERPLLSATLPNGYRVQIILPPACENGSITYSIRKPTVLQWTLDDYEKLGAFNKVAISEQESEDNEILSDLLHRGEIKEFLRQSVVRKKNIIVSGGTSTGKTTFVNALIRSIPNHERLITTEDAREITLNNHPNHAHLLASKGGQGRANVTVQDLIEACLRLRPDRIIVGELRGSEAFSFLRAINTGHPGSISTIHADTPLMALEQLKLMVMQAGLGMPPADIRDYIKQVIDIVVQVKRGAKSLRFISDIYFKGEVNS